MEHAEKKVTIMKLRPVTVFDENGHRIVRNKELNHRNPAKVRQKDPEGFHLHLMIPLEDAAKARQYCKGKMVKCEPKKGCKVRKLMRDMIIGDLVREYIHCLVKSIKLDGDSLEWYNKMHNSALELRERQDAMIAAGANRIPKDQQMKRGLGSASYQAKLAAKRAAEAMSKEKSES